MRVTAVEPPKRKVLAISFAEGPSLTLAIEIAAAHRIKVGTELSADQVIELHREDDAFRVHQAAVRFLSYRPRSEKEIRDRLRRAGFRQATLDAEVKKLRTMSLINDAAFAETWKDGREASRPRSKRVMRQELRRKGIQGDIVEQVVSKVDEEAGAYQAAAKKARSAGGLDEKSFYRQVGQFLQRRGYGYELSRRVVERLWQELRDGSAD